MNTLKITTLIIAGSILFGCGSSSNEGSSDEGGNSLSARTLVSDVLTINEDQYLGVKFSLSENAEIKTIVEIIDGPAIEAFLVTEAEYNTWVAITQNGQFSSATLNYFKDLSLSPVATKHESKWWGVDAGMYYYILENTNYGTTMPPFNLINDKATVEYSITIR